MVIIASKQVLWVAEKFKEAFPVKSFVAEFPNGEIRRVIWLRGFFYYIISLPEDQKQIPAKAKGTTRTFGNKGKDDYKRLSELWTKAQLEGLIDSKLIFDNRNDFMKESNNRVEAGISWRDIQVSSNQRYNLDLWEMNNLEDFKESINVDTYFKENQFTNQWYEILVVTEKLTVESIIAPLCKRYGANSLAVKGQQSYTRVNNICEKAQRTNRPILLLGIYDLDCAGWDMPNGFMKRIHQTYPHNDHKFIRVALTREQAESQNLPPAFEPDDKGYPEGQKERFYRESGGRTCIELDALDNSIIRDELGGYLYLFSGQKIDEIQKRRVEKQEKRMIDNILSDFEIGDDFEKKYAKALKRYNKFHSEVEKINEWLKAKYDYIHKKIEHIEETLYDDLNEEIERYE